MTDEHAPEAAATWSYEVPTVEGWYFHRAVDEVEVVRLEWGDFDGDGMQLGIEEWGLSADETGGEWAGPLTPPSESDHAG